MSIITQKYSEIQQEISVNTTLNLGIPWGISLIVEIEAAFHISLSPEEIYKIDSLPTALECIKDKNQ